MSKFRKRPVVIDAIQFRPGIEPFEFSQDVIDGTVRYTEEGTMLIQTLEGVMQAQPGDWIIRGVKGELYPCKPDIFEKSYEPVAPEPEHANVNPQNEVTTASGNRQCPEVHVSFGRCCYGEGHPIEYHYGSTGNKWPVNQRTDRGRGPKSDCDNCHGTGQYSDILQDVEMLCPCANGPALKAPRTNDSLADLDLRTKLVRWLHENTDRGITSIDLAGLRDLLRGIPREVADYQKELNALRLEQKRIRSMCVTLGASEEEDGFLDTHTLWAFIQNLFRTDELAPLGERMTRGRLKYPKGCTALSLFDEAGEIMHAINKYEPLERIRDELLDVAAVAMRLYLGEIDRGLTIDGLEQKRTDQPNAKDDSK